ncbi:hypothetical protein [Collimonas fungivorans]|uniref:hypothetical protein n=1 Tax=Collimonas fungivorans TaxID=158899 RepID=UPI003FA3CEF2
MRRLREATVTEILNANPLARDYGYRVAFRHFVKELSLVTARNGVQHRQYTRSKLRQIDGKLFVRLNGTLQEVTANMYALDLPGGEVKEMVWDLRIKSEYLPPLF